MSHRWVRDSRSACTNTPLPNALNDFSRNRYDLAMNLHLGRKGNLSTLGRIMKNEKKMLFCKQCFRKDIHNHVHYPGVAKAFLVVASLGLFLLFRPKRCVCCGTVRIT